MALTRSSDTMTLTGMDGLLRALKEIPDVAREELKHVVTLTAFSIAQRMRATVPRSSGLLANSISTSTRGLSGRVEIGVGAHYWHFLEYGTVRMEARPFIRPAGELEAPAFEQRLRGVAKKLEHAWGRR